MKTSQTNGWSSASHSRKRFGSGNAGRTRGFTCVRRLRWSPSSLELIETYPEGAASFVAGLRDRAETNELSCTEFTSAVTLAPNLGQPGKIKPLCTGPDAKCPSEAGIKHGGVVKGRAVVLTRLSTVPPTVNGNPANGAKGKR